jgi:transposase, IS30 family
VALDADIYFAYPKSSWKLGLNENTHGMIVQYFTKGSSFESITDENVGKAMKKLNHRPRKTLNYFCPCGCKHPLRSCLLMLC